MDLRARLTEDWPLFGLSVRTPMLELRYPSDADLLELAERSKDIHGAPDRPFAFAWNVGTDEERRRRVLQYSWRRRGEWTVDDWHLPLATVVDGVVVGSQEVLSAGYPVSRTVHTGSWIARAFHGRGIGTEMRAAVLHLAFAGLGALRAESGALDGNAASTAVSTKLGYRLNGDAVHVEGSDRRMEQRFALDRADWQARPRHDIDIVGLEACLPLFGLPAAGGHGIP
jgi:RimJ/RimL family protein N-acetyltransferase